MSGQRQRLYDGDTFDHRGYTFRVRYERDDYMGEPWTEHDGHGSVSEWTSREKRPGERILVRDTHGGSRRYYDFAAAVETARRDDWGPVHCAVCGAEAGGIGTAAYGTIHASEPTDHPFKAESKGATAARAAERDFEYLRSWCADEWEWTSVTVQQLENGRPTGEPESLSGIDGDQDNGQYLTSVAYELADELMTRIEVDDPDVVVSEN
jgi:hypothetical protein